MTTPTNKRAALELDTVADSKAPATSKSDKRARRPLFIGANWKLETNATEITLFRRHKSSWRPEGHFLSLRWLLESLVDAEVRQGDLSDLEGTVARIEQLKREIIAAVPAAVAT